MNLLIIIIESMPDLEGMNLSGRKLKTLLEKYASECLIILDGLDEHAMGQNQDVLEIIQGRKMLRCNVVVTSRPHTAIGIEKHFQTVVAVQGFTCEHASKLASIFLRDPSEVELALALSLSQFSISGEAHNPILLSIVCNLIKEGEVSLSSGVQSLSELYARLIRCLYRKYTVRKGIEYKVQNFVDVLRKVGRLAWTCLTSGNRLLVQKDLERDLGADAFDYGFLIGQGGIRLRWHETADIFVSFIHRSIEEFLGSTYFMLRLNDGECIARLLRADGHNSIIFQNPLFLHFCVWFLYQSETFIRDIFGTSFCHLQEHVGSLFVQEIDFTQLDFETLGQLFSVLSIFELNRDQLLSQYVQHLVSQSMKVEELVLHDYISFYWVAEIFNQFQKPRIKLIRIERQFFTSLQLLEKATLNTDSHEYSRSCV